MTTTDELAARRLAHEERLPSFTWYSVTDLARRCFGAAAENCHSGIRTGAA